MRDIMTDYFEYWDEHPTDAVKPIKHDGRRSEHEFRIELDDGLWFTGKIDAVVKARKMRWVMEHKTFARMPSEDDRWRSVQAAVYFKALEAMGFEEIDGVLWDYVNSKPCNAPGQLTATGKISQARIDSLPTRIRRWIKEEGLKKKDFAKMLADAEANRKNRFIRIYSPVKRPIVEMIWADFVDTAQEMRDFHGKKKDQNIGRHCSWCDYQALCKAEATGSDIDWIINREYTTEDLSHKAEDKDRNED
jgi:CRISPR/Cas system-associated exonuclease Cas4 (RecB family)